MVGGAYLGHEKIEAIHDTSKCGSFVLMANPYGVTQLVAWCQEADAPVQAPLVPVGHVLLSHF